MRIVTRDPFTRELETWRNTMEQLLNELPRTSYREDRPWVLPLDVIETEDQFIVKASIPGIDPDDLDITFSDNILTIQGEIKAESEHPEGRYLLRERGFGLFQRSIALPERVEADKIEATYKDGVLILSIPKVEEIKPKRISIKTK
ncbi:MAG TPA: Hsp20/alpha crystallin family protein [Anaerolineae bacterium]|nr:Hsp20/alpha crystallin family protein [Caldilineae bacterium]HID33392.1 Hsp20/alpha crystallin family protein [Anaerolineae bacterium]HIQ12065.1 Hsp20/alpha crystallin family protein [Caldilineales bacterium]